MSVEHRNLVLCQDILRTDAAQRLRRIRPDLAQRFDLADGDDLRAAYETAASPLGLAAQTSRASTQQSAIVVVRSFDPIAWMRDTCAFTLGLDAHTSAAWRRELTRTVFLAGNPQNLRHRFAFDRIADDGSVAWLAPAPASATLSLRRLLTAFDGDAEFPSATGTAVVPPCDRAAPRPEPVHYDVHIATARTRLSDCLIALNHLLVEAVIEGDIRPGDSLCLHRSPTLVGVSGPFTAIRSTLDTVDSQRLRAQAILRRAQ